MTPLVLGGVWIVVGVLYIRFARWLGPAWIRFYNRHLGTSFTDEAERTSIVFHYIAGVVAIVIGVLVAMFLP